MCDTDSCRSRSINLILLVGLTCLCTGSLSMGNNEVARDISFQKSSFVTGINIPQHDQWCGDNCFNVETCNERFQSDYIDLQIRTRHSIKDGPGQHLIYNGRFQGTTIARQSFETQFVKDISETTLGISPCKVHILDISSVGRDFNSVLIIFRLYEIVHDEIHDLTRQIQNHKSLFYSGKITSAADQLFGLVIPSWDFSIRLNYAIDNIGRNETRIIDNEIVLNQGSERWCKGYAKNELEVISSSYCEFEGLFENDLIQALSSFPSTKVERGQVVVLFVKESGIDSIIISCRFLPPIINQMATNSMTTNSWVKVRLYKLVELIKNQSMSALYSGNTTFRLDPSWGVSNKEKMPRLDSKRLNKSVRATPINSYSRCKDTHRCGRGWSFYNDTDATSTFTTQLFAGGEHIPIDLFADFEDWKQGSNGWRKKMDCIDNSILDVGCVNKINNTLDKRDARIPKGAHWSPFDFESLGPSIQSFNTSSNNGLVLNRERLFQQVKKQQHWISEIEDYLLWLKSNIEITSLEAITRFRKDIRVEIERTILDYEKILSAEKEKEIILRNSQCTQMAKCSLLFNSSNLELSGAINATGAIGTTPDGSEIAIWTFDSIDIGIEVNIEFIGQRAIALLSKSSVSINTDLIVAPGTLGGFPGGYSVSRVDRLNHVCNENRPQTFSCDGDYPLMNLNAGTISNNVNGPGSGSVCVYSYMIKTSALVVHEVQSLKTDASMGQVIKGGFILHFNGYSTPFIPHDVTGKRLQSIMEDSLNAAKVNSLQSIDRTKIIVPGVGKLRITRHNNGLSGGYEWRITFLTAVGNIGEIDSSPLTVTNLLRGIGASVAITTLINGNTIGGSFNISFLSNQTRPLDHDVSAEEMESIILQDISAIETVEVTRTGILDEKCNDGLCSDGPYQAGGYLWSLVLTTQTGSLSPSSPTSLEFNEESMFEILTVNNNLSGCIEHKCPNIEVQMGHEKYTKNFRVDRPFSISIGGRGAGFGGNGGEHDSQQIRKTTYGDLNMTNLLGGSGGALGFDSPFHSLMVGIPGQVRGGSGGGAIEIVAINDITIGANARISCNGERGWANFARGGGGGSGGSILLSANGNINIKGFIETKGGDGGKLASYRNDQNNHTGFGGGGGGGRIAIFGKSITGQNFDVSGGRCGMPSQDISWGKCAGEKGTIYTQVMFGHTFFIDDTSGAMGTNHSLRFKPPAMSEIDFWLDPRNQYDNDGPEFLFFKNSTPRRVSYFIKFEPTGKLKPMKRWGITIALKNNAKGSLSNSSANQALYLSIGERSMHGFSEIGGPNNVNFEKRLSDLNFLARFNNWHHIDIRLDWKRSVYDIYIDNLILVRTASLNMDAIQSLAIFIPLSNVDIWFDEVYVGEDTSMGSRCPHIFSDENIENNFANESRGWKESELGGPTLYKPMTRHESHLTRRPLYQRADNGSLVMFDGENQIYHLSDLKSRNETGRKTDHLDMSSIFLHYNTVSGMNVYYWYNEHYYVDIQQYGLSATEHIGAVTACSTTDLIHWRNEGVMLHYINITDMVSGSDDSLHVEKPVVLFNKRTNKFVMWMIIDNPNRTLAMAGVATSDYADGPFTFVRSFYPDGNKTRDQALFKDDDGIAYLVRTYYHTTEYTRPAAVMQPIWESVKNEDSSINFPLSHHRAHYEPGYDDFHDIYLQRWRGEDKPWKIVCINRQTQLEREIPHGREGIDVCDHKLEYKKVIGQSSPLYETTKDGIRSRFLDPNNKENNYWKPNSVPSVQGQSWSANYADGSCGHYVIGNDLHPNDPTLPQREQPDRGNNCSNIADNPIHTTIPDKRIGREEIILKRTAKFVAVSRLTHDYLDTSGILWSYEGELENGSDISSIVSDAKKHFYNAAGDSIQDAYFTPIHLETEEQTMHWDHKLHQFENEYNDRSFHSLACVIDGKCPINFKTDTMI